MKCAIWARASKVVGSQCQGYSLPEKMLIIWW